MPGVGINQVAINAVTGGKAADVIGVGVREHYQPDVARRHCCRAKRLLHLADRLVGLLCQRTPSSGIEQHKLVRGLHQLGMVGDMHEPLIVHQWAHRGAGVLRREIRIEGLRLVRSDPTRDDTTCE